MSPQRYDIRFVTLWFKSGRSTHCYFSLARFLVTVQGRRTYLQQQWGFTCNCELCQQGEQADGESSDGRIERRVNEAVAAVLSKDLSAMARLHGLSVAACEGEVSFQSSLASNAAGLSLCSFSPRSVSDSSSFVNLCAGHAVCPDAATFSIARIGGACLFLPPQPRQWPRLGGSVSVRCLNTHNL